MLRCAEVILGSPVRLRILREPGGHTTDSGFDGGVPLSFSELFELSGRDG